MGKLQELRGPLMAGGLLGAALVFSGERVADRLNAEDARSRHPSDLVCSVALRPGESPASLADDSAFEADAELVIQRSQFINPEATLQFADEDESNFTGYFNIQRGVEGRLLPDPIDPSYNYQVNYSDSCITGARGSEMADLFPSLTTAARIMKSTVALMDSGHEDEVISQWRCGAIAISEAVVVLPSSNVSAQHECDDLVSGEVGNAPLRIEDDREHGQWRYVEVSGKRLAPVELAKDYIPSEGDQLVYSGYDRGGSRQYFRMIVGGSNNGKVLLQAGIDLNDPSSYGSEYPQGYPQVQGGGGGIFTYDGRLVAILESTARFEKISYGSGFDEHITWQREYNTWLSNYLSTYGLEIDADYDTGDSYPPVQQQFVTAVLAEDMLT